ncbi:MAG: transglycosylase SLT domain-containing protein [Actinomycetota bacterium]
MMGQSGGGRELQEVTSYRIFHALRFPIVGALIVLLAVSSVVISLTEPTESTFLEEAFSQSALTPAHLETSITDKSTETEVPQIQEDQTSGAQIQKEQNRYTEALRSENKNFQPYTPNFVPKGDLITTVSSFSPPPPTYQNIEPAPILENPPPQDPGPDPEIRYVDDVEQWRQSVGTAINAYGGPSSDTNRFLRIMQCESMGQPNATNPSSGAAGLMQHLPQYWDARAASAGYSGYSAYDPIANINVSAWLIYQAPGGGWQHWVCQ